jgi:hypothetical protein
VSFIAFCKKAIANYVNEHFDKTGVKIKTENVYAVWYCKTLQNWKALLSTTLPNRRYYEVTYNGDKGEAYLDIYQKWENRVIKGGDT